MNNEDDYIGVQNPLPAYGENLDKSFNPEIQNSDPSSPAELSNDAPVSAKGMKQSISPINGEVNLLASFTWEPNIDAQTEIEYLQKGKWQASTEDFKAIVGSGANVIFPQNFSALLGMIAAFAPKSIGRLNFFTHADPTSIGITGRLDETGVYYKSSISGQTLINHADNNYRYDFMGKSFDIGDVRDRFSSNAIMIIYGCETAFDPKELLQGLQQLLQITIIGFKERTVFCPPAQQTGSKIFNRKGERIGIDTAGFNCSANSTTDWRSLINHPKAVKVGK